MIHSFLRSIGFSEIRENTTLYDLLETVVNKPDRHSIIKDPDGNEMAWFCKYICPDMGICVFGNFVHGDEFRIEYYYPFFSGSSITTSEPVEVERHAAQISFAGICDDLKIGVTLIFYVQNVMDVINELKQNRRPVIAQSTVLSGLSSNGKILLPVKKTKKEIAIREKSIQERRNLLQQAKEGDHAAIENLTLNEMDTYSVISRRLMKEDVLSIVETSFIPYGVESDQYMILGEILNFYKAKNQLSQEDVWVLTLSCNELQFDVCINAKDLLGEPEVGRRFRGRVWLTGYLNFN